MTKKLAEKPIIAPTTLVGYETITVTVINEKANITVNTNILVLSVTSSPPFILTSTYLDTTLHSITRIKICQPQNPKNQK